MNKPLLAICGFVLGICACTQNAGSGFMPAFTEDFNSPEQKNFNMRRSELRYYSGVHSLTEENTNVMLMQITPADGAGPTFYGSEIYTPKYTHFGTYSARLRMPSLKEVQPNAGIVTGYFTYEFTPGFGLSEIDFEWLMADPSIIYIGTWTSAPDDVEKLQRIERVVNLATGEILHTCYFSYHDAFAYEAPKRYFDESDDAALEPRTIEAIPGYDASGRFYVYGFDWYPDRLRWWVENPDSGEKVVLWDYRGATPNYSGIPQPPTVYMLNFWHTNSWSVPTVPGSTEAPKCTYLLEADWMKYEPFDDLSAEWITENNYQIPAAQ